MLRTVLKCLSAQTSQASNLYLTTESLETEILHLKETWPASRTQNPQSCASYVLTLHSSLSSKPSLNSSGTLAKVFLETLQSLKDLDEKRRAIKSLFEPFPPLVFHFLLMQLLGIYLYLDLETELHHFFPQSRWVEKGSRILEIAHRTSLGSHFPADGCHWLECDVKYPRGTK